MSPRAKKLGRPFEPHAVARSDDANAFIPDPGDGPALIDDDLAESLAEGFLEGATTAQDTDEDRLNSGYPEEIGGPFIETSAEAELARDTDGNNPPDATREPLPLAVAGIVSYPSVETPGGEELFDPDADDAEEEAREDADPGIVPRAADPARDIEELNDEARARGRRTNS